MAAFAAIGLAGCNTSGLPGLDSLSSNPAPQTAPQQAEIPVIPGKVRVGLILPLTAPGNAGVAGAALKNAADMAIAEFNGSKVQLLVKDDRGTPDGAREAAQQALAEGAEIIVGPLLAPSVQAVGQVARGANRSVIAFSTDATVASRGVYLLSFMPESDVDRIVEFAVSRGKKSIAALIPNSAYGNVVAAAFQEAAARRNVRVPALERYDRGTLDGAVRRIAAVGDQADALFVPESGDGMAAVGQALTTAGISSQRLQPLGTGVWDDPRVLSVKAIQGGWFSAPEKAGFNAFASRYRARFGTEPTRIASLAYDAVFLVDALYGKLGSQGFSDATLTNPEGIVGTDGLFRFRQDGTNQRGLAVLQVGGGSAQTISPAPRAFSPGT
ncbi:penicillin-binding protein activator [uncultured Alsobacter sp.]|uniref:penicillin-binding protein activator n=1 Tax=uncultured Alsobacter sp. TaxID=1748258 RepID=UPI0025E3BCCD|nr:penicillin-binding protein activator [uncultured Alsobacter sp.]